MRTGAIFNVTFDFDILKNPLVNSAYGNRMLYIQREIKGKVIFEHILERLKRVKGIDKIVAVTSNSKIDEDVVRIAKECGIEIFIDNAPSYQERSLKAAREFNIDVIVDINVESVFFDPECVDAAIKHHIATNADITYMKGFIVIAGVIIMSSNVLEKWSKLDLSYEGKLVGPFSYAYSHPGLFKIEEIKAEEEYPRLSLLLRNYKDFGVIKRIYNRLYIPGEIINNKDVIKLFNEEPELFKLGMDEFDIEITNDCNLSCIMCPRRKMTREIGYMDMELYKKMINECKRIDVGGINLTLYGEPTMHPDFLEMVRYAKSKNISVNLFTNGTLLDEAISRELIDNNLDAVIFSLDAANSETYKSIKRSGEFDKVKENIRNFLTIKQQTTIPNPKEPGERLPTVALQIIKMKENDQEIEQFFNEWDWQDKIKKMINYKQRMERSKKYISIEETVKGMIESFELRKEYQKALYEKAKFPIEHVVIGHYNNFCGEIEDRSVIDVTPLKRFPCRQLNEGVSILWNGDVTLCRQDFDGRMVIGNLRNESLENILNSPKRKEIIEAQEKGDYSKGLLCPKCKDWYYPRA